MQLIKYGDTFVQVNHTFTTYEGPFIPPEPPVDNYLQLTNRGSDSVVIVLNSASAGNVFIDDVFTNKFSPNSSVNIEIPAGSVVKITGATPPSTSSALLSDSSTVGNLSIDRFDESITDYTCAFNSFESLKSITSWNGASDIEKFDTTFADSGLTSIPSSWNGLDSIQSLSQAFSNCLGITTIPESWTGIETVTNVQYMFSNCYNLVSGGTQDADALDNLDTVMGMVDYCISWTGDAYALYQQFIDLGLTPVHVFDGDTNSNRYDEIPKAWGGGNDGITGEYTLIRNIGTTAVDIRRSDITNEEMYLNGDLQTARTVHVAPGDTLKVFNMNVWNNAQYDTTQPIPKLSLERFGTGYYSYNISCIKDFITRITSWEGCYNPNTRSAGRIYFTDWTNLESIPSSWEGISYKNASGTETVMLSYSPLFRNCYKLASIPNTWAGLKVSTLYGAFQNCTSLEEIPESWESLDSNMITANSSTFRASHMFDGCTSLRTGGSTGFARIAQIRYIRNMFDGCINWEGTDVNAFRMVIRNNYSTGSGAVTSEYVYAFGNCVKATNFDQLPHIWSRVIPQDILATNNYEEIVVGPNVDNIGTVFAIEGSLDDTDFGVFIRNGEVVEALPLGYSYAATTILGYRTYSDSGNYNIPYNRPLQEGEVLRLYSTSGELLISSNGGDKLWDSTTSSFRPVGEISIRKFNPARARTFSTSTVKPFIYTNSGPYASSANRDYYVKVRITSWSGTENYLYAFSFLGGARILEIPSSWNGFGARRMNYFFDNCEELTTIPNSWSGLENVYEMAHAFNNTGITAIPDSWEGLDSLTSSYVQGVQMKGLDYAFCGTKLTYIPTPQFSSQVRVNIYNEQTFSKINTLTSINWVYDTGSDIPRYFPGFNGCRNLQTVTVSTRDGTGATIRTWSEGMFAGCNRLTSVSFPNNFTLNISAYGAFRACRKLTNAYELYNRGVNGDMSFEGCISDPNYQSFPASKRGSDDYGYTMKYTFFNVDANFDPNVDVAANVGYWEHNSGNTWTFHMNDKQRITGMYDFFPREHLANGVTYRLDEISVAGNSVIVDSINQNIVTTYDLESIGDTACQQLAQLCPYLIKFNNLTKLKILPIIRYVNVTLTDIRRMYAYCENVESNILAAYEYLSSLSSITNHSSTFYQCGVNTESGSAELAQIPSDWKRSY